MSFHLGKWCVVSVVLVMSFQAAVLADGGRPSRADLDAMGLSGLRVMSDDEAMSIRGQGAFVFGHSFARVAAKGAIAGSTNGYSAKGKKRAEGENFSFARIEVKMSGKKGGGKHDRGGGKNNTSSGKNSKGGRGGGHGAKPKTWSIGAFSGGYSIAKTK